jgi:hypothetical protein
MNTQLSDTSDVQQIESGSVSPDSFIGDLVLVKSLPKSHLLYAASTGSEAPGRTENNIQYPQSTDHQSPGIPPGIRPRVQPVRLDSIISHRKWEGVVLRVMEDSFLARLVDLTQKGPDEEAEIALEELSQEDRKLVEPGAIFYWSIGYLDRLSGQRTRVSLIRFRRLPKPSEEDIAAIGKQARQLQELIGW